MSTKFFLLIFFIILFTAVSLGGTSLRNARKEIEETLVKKISSRIQSLAYISAYSVFVEDNASLSRIVKSQMDDPEVAYIVFRDGNGKALAYEYRLAWWQRWSRWTPPDHTLLGKEPQQKEKSFIYNDKSRKLYEAIFPLYLKPDPALEEEIFSNKEDLSAPVGWIQMGFTTQLLEKAINNFRNRLLLMLVPVVLFFVGISGLFIRQIIRPIRALVEGTKRIGDGDLEYRVPITTRDEVGRLSYSFNIMAENLEKALKTIQDYSKNLEKKVEERTNELKLAKEDLENAYNEIKELDKLKSSFLSLVSHELRTPLTSIRSFSEILINYDEVDPGTRKEFLGIINSESERLTRLINDVLDLSRIEAGRMVWNDDLISLEEISDDMAKIHNQLLQEKSLQVVTDIPSDLPCIFADKDRIQQVMTNLIGNAIKFSFEGGEIRIHAEVIKGKRFGETSEWIKMGVSDQGIGIEEKDQKIIFDKFRQASADTLIDRPKGSGLGLPICKEIISHYGGNIWVESEKGKGSTLFFTLPGVTVPAKPLKVLPPLEKQVPGWRGKTILVVDDNANMRRLLRYQLHTRGYTVLEAADGNQALELAKKERIDMITLDLMMPLMSGYNVLGTIREDPITRDIPVLIISVVEDKETGLLMGANDYLKKPFREEDLVKKVQSLLGEERQSVLVVDDERPILESIRFQLEKRGYPVHLACDGEEALDFLKDQVPALVILDVLMPKKNGYEVLNWIRNEPHTRHLPVIILSNYPLSEERVKLLSLGIEAYIEKSRGLSILFEKIDSLLLSPPK